MPIYCYVCDICGKELEVTQKMNDPDPVCENCSKENNKIFMKKQISRTSFILKGSGWYRDGYSPSNKGK